MDIVTKCAKYQPRKNDRWKIPKQNAQSITVILKIGARVLLFGVAAHFDYDPEWTNERRVFEISANQNDRSQNAQQHRTFSNGVSMLPVIPEDYFSVLLRILTTIFLIG